MKIEEISLETTLPEVFVGEKIADSEVWNCNLRFLRGEKYQVEAASGAGKSSLCSFLYGSRGDYRGRISFNGQDIRNLKISQWQEIRRNNLAYLPQELMLFPELTAIENIRLKNNLTGYAEESQISNWLERLGISARRNFPVGKMSVGQQQRVAIIRAICQPFDFIMLDEPVSHLDAENNKIAAAIIEEVVKSQGAGIISTSVGNPLLIVNAVKVRL